MCVIILWLLLLFLKGMWWDCCKYSICQIILIPCIDNSSYCSMFSCTHVLLLCFLVHMFYSMFSCTHVLLLWFLVHMFYSYVFLYNLQVEQLAMYTEEESIILTASISDGTLSHLGSDSGKSFLDDNEAVKSQFLSYCLQSKGFFCTTFKLDNHLLPLNWYFLFKYWVLWRRK